MAKYDRHMIRFRGDILRSLIKKKKLTPADITRQLIGLGLFYGPAQIEKLIEGKQLQPRGDVLYGFCKIFKVPVERFYEK